MNINELEKLVQIIDTCKSVDVRKLLVDHLTARLSTPTIPTIAPLKIEDLYPTSYKKCPVCFLDGTQGYVCNRGDCPCKITCRAS